MGGGVGDLLFELFEPGFPLGCGDVLDLDDEEAPGGFDDEVADVFVEAGAGAGDCPGVDGFQIVSGGDFCAVAFALIRMHKRRGLGWRMRKCGRGRGNW